MKTDFIEWTKNNLGLRIEKDSSATEEEIAKLKKEFPLEFPEDYIELLLHSNGITFYNHHEAFSFYTVEDLLLLNDDPDYSERLEGLFIIGNDNGGSFYAFDPNDNWHKGQMAVFRMDRGALKRSNSQYLGADLREVLTKLNEEVQFHSIPTLSEESWHSLIPEAKDIYALIKFDPAYKVVLEDRRNLLGKNDVDMLRAGKLPDEYYSLLCAYYKVNVLANGNSALFFSVEDAGLINKDSALTEPFAHLFFFADDGKALLFAFDVENKYEKGVNAIFLVAKQSDRTAEPVFLAGNLLEFFEALKGELRLSDAS
jgi:hypothetical protein